MNTLSSAESLEWAAEDEDDIHTSKKRHHSLSKGGLKALREATIEQIVKGDKDVEYGISLFFNNRVQDSEKLFGRYAAFDPLHALGASVISTIKAMLSLAKNDMEIAVEKLSYTITFAEELISSEKAFFDKLANTLRRSGSRKRLLPGEFRAKAILADALVLRGFILLLQHNSISGIVKGGMALNKSYSLFKSLTNELDERKDEKKASSYDDIGLDRNSVHNALTGFGCINVVISMLPPRVLRILNFLGFTHDRELGMGLISECWRSQTLISPLAGLFIMAVNSFISGFCSLTTPLLLPVANETAKEAIQRQLTADSLIHLWLMGRISRLHFNMDESIALLSKCLEVADRGQIATSMPQLRDFAVYDQTWNYAASLRWEDCIKNYASLEANSAWSKIFYAYAQGCAYEMLLRNTGEVTESEALYYRENATAAYWRAAHHKVTVMGGRTVTIESFVAHRLNDIFRQAGIPYPNPGNKAKLTLSVSSPSNNVVLRNVVPLPMLELLVLFDIMHQLPLSYLEVFVRMIDDELGFKASSPSQTPRGGAESLSYTQSFSITSSAEWKQRSAVLLAMKAVILSHVPGQEESVCSLLQEGIRAAREYKGRGCTLSWITPWMFYEEASLAFKRGDLKKCAELLGKLDEINEEQVFRAIMETKLHFARWVLRDAKLKQK
ncbi:tetratricopeptidedomain 39C [Trypanosoma rangeli]|uniref:Tetratricopeptidedomain 39C n=1 Tax=Trypanosoma rangeli TaxID=5698 RepID=A0A3R7K1I3_TRYRA|nr:tetratricopeptidedomain 39C [Trypanosoma rangeli]RNE98928.1 tetratricopeptidedomain 39C [Trypanosoma rangeli]|eukprot:RNE98928.1 tetratricopeptidedomain 39C [Trypanosoma rangeli]